MVETGTKITLKVQDDTTPITFSNSWTYSTGFSEDTWYHIALIRGWGGNANDYTVTVNGESLTAATLTAYTFKDYAGNVKTAYDLDGYMDRHRLRKKRLGKFPHKPSGKRV